MAATGNIDQLNFEVILDDKDFQNKIAKDVQLATNLNTQLSNILTMSTSISPINIISSGSNTTIKEIKGSLNDIKKIADDLATKKVISDGSVENAKEVEKSAKSTSEHMRKLQQLIGVTFGVEGIRRFVSEVANVTGEFEVQQMALRSMIGDVNKADAIFGELRKRALESPYTFQDLSKYAKQLAAFNIDADQLVETENRLADVAAGLGVDMGRIILAYGQVKAAGVLKGTELRQFTEAGVPLLQSLADQIERTTGKTINLAQVFDMISKKQIPFEMVEQAFRDMTSEGGKFYKMQEVLVETLQGKIGKLRDAWQQLLYETGNNSSGLLKGTVDGLTNLIKHFDTIGAILAPLIKAFGAYAVTLGIVAVAQKAALGVEAILGLKKALEAATTASAAISAYGAALLPIVGIVAVLGFGIAAYVKHVNDANKASERAIDVVKEFHNEADKEIWKLDELKGKLESSEKGTQDFVDAKNEIINNYGKYLPGLDKEIEKVGNLTTSYDNLTEAIKRSMAERKYAEFEQSERALFDQMESDFLDDYQKRIYKELGPEEGYKKYKELKNLIEGDRGNNLNEVINFIPRSGLYGNKGYSLIRDFKKVDKAYSDYLSNLRFAIDKFGLKGSELDPDFIGPIFKKTTDSINETIKPKWDPLPKGKPDAQEKIESEIKLLQKYKDAYEKLKPFLVTGDQLTDGSLVNDVLSEIFGTDIDVDKLDDQIIKLANDLSKFGEDAARSAENIKAGLGKDEVSDYVDRLRALEKYEKTLRKWEKDWGNTYSGLDRKIYDVVAAYNDEEKAIEDEYTDAMKEMQEAYGDNVEAIERETEALDKLKQARHEANNASAQEKISNLAKEAVKEARETLNMKDWGDKSFTQVRDIWNGIQDLMKDKNFGVSEEILEKVKEAGLSFDEFFKAVEEGYEEMGEETKDEKVKKIIKLSKFAAQQFVKLADSIKELGEASGSGFLTSLGDTVNKLSSSVSNIAQGYATGGPWGVAIASIAEVGKMIINATTEMAKFKEALASAAEEARVLQAEARLSLGVNTLFGDDEYKSVMNAAKELEDLQKRVDKQREKRYLEEKHWNDGTYRWNTDISLASMAKAVGGELYDEYGNLNAKTLQSILETYGDLSKKSKDWLDKAINDSKLYEQAIRQIGDAFESVFGNIAENAADAIIDQWVEAGNAALEYADILDDVARSYAKMLIKSSIIDQVLNEDEANRIAKMFSSGNQSGAMEAIAEDMEKIKAMEPVFADILESFQPYFKGSESSESNSLGSGIKSITEDTAGLLASYINAIRADVSVMRGLQQAGWQNVSAILGFLQSPTLNDHIAQTAANTFDIAQSNMRILSELQSVIRSGSNGGMVVMAEIG